MCTSCNKIIKMNRFDLKIEGNKLVASYNAYSCDSSFNDEATINFCPMCGKKLDVPEEKSK